MFDIDLIDTKLINPSSGYYGTIDFIKNYLSDHNEVPDDYISWIVNPLPIYASLENEELKRVMEEHTRVYQEKEEESLRLVARIKNEFYDFLCTESDYYKKDRNKIGGDINTLITSLSVAVATKLGGLEVGIVTSFIALFIIICAKMTKNVACSYFHKTKK